MRANPFSDAAVAFAQRVWLSKLQAMQPDRPIAAQTQKTDTWAPWDTYPATARLWTRGVLLNELLCDVDSPDKELNETICSSWSASARDLGAKPLGPIDSGGRGWHAHVWYDVDGLYVDGKLLDACEKHDVDIWKVIRETLWDLVCAKLPAGMREKLDEGKVRWSSKKQGSMVRDFGSVGRLGYAKTLGDVPMVVTPDELPPLWDVNPYRAQIEASLTAAVENAKHAKDAAKQQKRDLKTARSALEAHPCVREALKNGAPVGERGTTGLHLLRLCRAEGLSAEQAAAVARAYMDACERAAPMSDDVVAKVPYVYAQEPGGIKCPNPMKLAVCEQTTGCPKRRVCLTS